MSGKWVVMAMLEVAREKHPRKKEWKRIHEQLQHEVDNY
jgi:hypothetical protein